MNARRILALLLTAALLGAMPAASHGAAPEGPPASAAAKAKSKKCKKKKARGGKKARKCKRKAPRTRPGGGGGLPGKALEPDPPVDPLVSFVSVAPSPVLGGQPSAGTVTLVSPAESGGQQVDLASSAPSRAVVPASVTVPAGEKSVGFGITTTSGAATTVGITASIGSSSAQEYLSIVAQASVTGLALDRQCFPSDDLTAFGANRVDLDIPAPADTPVGLESDLPLALTVPGSVMVAEGSTSAIFGVDTLAAAAAVTVTASLNGTSASDTASVRDGSSPDSAVAGLSLSPSAIQPGDGSTGTVTLDCEAGPGGAAVTLSSDDGEVGVPASVVVPEDSLSATFPITTTPDATGSVTISATLGGTQQATLLVENLGT